MKPSTSRRIQNTPTSPRDMIIGGVVMLVVDILMRQFSNYVCQIWFMPLWVIALIVIAYGVIQSFSAPKK